MKVGFYAPMKPVDHPQPSGDQIIARQLVHFFQRRGFSTEIVSRYRTRWFYRNWKKIIKAPFSVWSAARQQKLTGVADFYFTYHSYYKAPDFIGPFLSWLFRKPYFIFEGMYSKSPSRSLKTSVGYWINRWALKQAKQVFVYKTEDLEGLRSLLAAGKISYIPQGIDTQVYQPNLEQRKILRNQLGWNEDWPIVVCCAMLREDRKTQGVEFLISALKELKAQGRNFYFLHIGGGPRETFIRGLSTHEFGSHCFVTGTVDRDEVCRLLQASDIFAFPGIDEGFGMVYLEAQACGLPIVAWNNGGIPDAVGPHSGFLTQPENLQEYQQAIGILLENNPLREKMSQQSRAYVLQNHDLCNNWGKMLSIIEANLS